MLIVAQQFRRALAANSTSTAFTLPAAVTTEPSGTGVIDLLNTDNGWGAGSLVPSILKLCAFGVGADDATFDFRVFGWSKLAGESVWIPLLLVDVSVLLSATSVATALGSSNVFGDTLTINDGPADNSEWRSVIDCQENMPASVNIHSQGCRYLSFDFDMILATNGNVLIRPLD